MNRLEMLSFEVRKLCTKPFVITTWYRAPTSPVDFFSPHFSAGFFFLKKVSCLHLQNVVTFTLWLLQ